MICREEKIPNKFCHEKKYIVRFNNKEQQKLYEKLIKEGYHWRAAESKTITIYKENGYEY